MKRTDIQALRGFAVLAVLLFHIQVSAVKGGFLGVDIFFVISGFVITDRLARAEGTLRFQIVDFYRRRAKRILPSSLLVIILTTVMARIYLAPISFSRFRFDALWTALFAGNIRFAAQGNNYLDQTLSPTPFLHYWSLGVEEQFYLLWPIIFLLIVKRRRWLLAPLLLLSTLFAIWYTNMAPVNSFYLPFSRAWEFLAGIVVALVVPRFTRGSNLVALFGWIGVTISIFAIGSHDKVPGLTTLIPVVSAAFILSARRNFSWLTPFEKLGDYSYAIYLIHWPLVVFALSRYQGINLRSQILIFCAALIGGYLISRFIENPFRFNSRLSLTLPKWGAAIAATLSLVLLSGSIPFSYGKSNSIQLDLTVPIIYSDHCHLDFGVSTPSSACLFGDTHSSTEVVLTGDSHAAQWFPAFVLIAKRRHWKLLSLTKSSCPASVLATYRNGISDKACVSWQKFVAHKIAQDQPAKVFITSFSEYTYPLASQRKGSSYPSRFAAGEVEFIRSLGLPMSSIYLLEDTPQPSQNIPECLSRNTGKSQACDFPAHRSDATRAMRKSLTGLGIHYLSLQDVLCPNGTCTSIYAGRNAYRDGSHISVSTSVALTSYLNSRL